MTNDEAIENLKGLLESNYVDSFEDEENKALDMAIKALEQEPCEDAISRDAVDKYIARLLSGYLYDGERERLEIFSAYLWELPSVTPQKHGKWIVHPEIETSTPEYLMFYECSECGDKQCFCRSDLHKKRYCPNCGSYNGGNDNGKDAGK